MEDKITECQSLLWLYQCKREHAHVLDQVNRLQASIELTNLWATIQALQKNCEELGRVLGKIERLETLHSGIECRVQALDTQLRQIKEEACEMQGVAAKVDRLEGLMQARRDEFTKMLERGEQSDAKLGAIEDKIAFLQGHRQGDVIVMRKMERLLDELAVKELERSRRDGGIAKHVQSLLAVNAEYIMGMDGIQKRVEAAEKKISLAQCAPGLQSRIENRLAVSFHEWTGRAEYQIAALRRTATKTLEIPSTALSSQFQCPPRPPTVQRSMSEATTESEASLDIRYLEAPVTRVTAAQDFADQLNGTPARLTSRAPTRPGEDVTRMGLLKTEAAEKVVNSGGGEPQFSRLLAPTQYNPEESQELVQPTFIERPQLRRSKRHAQNPQLQAIDMVHHNRIIDVDPARGRLRAEDDLTSPIDLRNQAKRRNCPSASDSAAQPRSLRLSVPFNGRSSPQEQTSRVSKNRPTRLNRARSSKRK